MEKKWTEKDTMNLKMAMLKKYNKTSYNVLAKEIGYTRQSVANAMNNHPYATKVRESLYDFINSVSKAKR